jgi:hypothetical protein
MRHPPASLPNTPADIAARVKAIIAAIASLSLWKILLTLVSGFTTTIGLMKFYDVLGDDHGTGGMGTLAVIIPITISGALHALIFFALNRWVVLRRRRYLFAIAIPLQIVAVCCSYGYHWTHLRGPMVTAQDYAASQSSVIRSVRAFGASYRSMAGSLGELAAHSEKQAKNEEEVGTSCGTQAGAGRSSRYDLRISDRDRFSGFNAEIARRVTELAGLIESVEKLSASSATQAIANVNKLKRIVDQARGFREDALLRRLTTAAEERRQRSRAPMPSTVGRKAATFTCPDNRLDGLLLSVIESVKDLKPIAEVSVKDSRDPRVGFVAALRRLAASIGGLQLSPKTRDQLAGERKREISGATPTNETEPEDFAPLVVAAVIEILLTALFACGSNGLQHPAVADLQSLSQRRAENPVFEAVWKTVGGQGDREQLRRAIAKNAKHESDHLLLFVPVYSAKTEHLALHDFMRVLTHVGLARISYTGSMMAALLTAGMPPDRKTEIQAHGGVRVFKISAIDYLALLLDGSGAQAVPT